MAATLPKPLPPLTFLHECFKINKKEGGLIWRPRPRSHFRTDRGHTRFNSCFAGTDAGNFTRTGATIYRRVDITGVGKFFVHRIVWALCNNKDPLEYVIDHRDGDGLNNRPTNLRKATASQNMWNHRTRVRSGSGYRGVWHINGKYRARIQSNSIYRYSKEYNTPEEAAAEYKRLSLKLHGKFSEFHKPLSKCQSRDIRSAQ